MQTKVLVNGAQGKMGRLACETLRQHPDFDLVATLSRGDDLGKTIRSTEASIVIDLTSADSVFINTETIIHHEAHPVIGTSGLSAEEIEKLQRISAEKKWGGIIVPNFSIAAVLMMQFAAKAAAFLPEVEIIEGHHPQKLDAPSGTAMKTASMIAAARKTAPKLPVTKALLAGARGALLQDIPIHSLRLPGLLARQEVIFGQPGETLTITHNTIDRLSFMPGVLLACQKVAGLDGLYYGLEHLLD